MAVLFSITGLLFFVFFFNDTATTEIYTLSLHDALPISAVAEVVDVVGVAAALAQLDQVADDRDEVVLREDRVVLGDVHLEPLVDLVAAHPPQVVALGAEEQPLQRLPSRLEDGRLAGTQQRVDLLPSLCFGVRG